MKPEILLLTSDPSLARTVARTLPEDHLDWRQSFTTGLTGITSDTRTLIVDADIGAPMAHLLAALFLDQRPGRSAVVVQAPGTPLRAHADSRVQVLDRPLTPQLLSDALTEAAEVAAACEALETLARRGASPAVPPAHPQQRESALAPA